MNNYFVELEACPVCGSRQIESLCRLSYTDSPVREYMLHHYPKLEFSYFDGANFGLGECQACGFIFQVELPTAELLEKFYSYEWIASSLPPRRTYPREFLYIAEQIATMLKTLGRPGSETRFLDYGMGDGEWCLMAKAFGCDVYGTDVSGHSEANAERLGITFVKPEELSGQHFDLINLNHVLEHIPNPVDKLRELKPLLAEAGLLRIASPTCHDVRARLRRPDAWAEVANSPIAPVTPVAHINLFNFDVLALMAERVGLRVLDVTPLGGEAAQTKGLMRRSKALARQIRDLVLRRQSLRKPTLIFLSTPVSPG
jgi:SAM-dependent methyltransferase